MTSSLNIPSLDDISDESFDRTAWLRNFMKENGPPSEQIFASLEDFLRTEISRRVEQFEDSLFKATLQLPALHRQATRIDSSVTDLQSHAQILSKQLEAAVHAPLSDAEKPAATSADTVRELVGLAKCADAAQAALRQLQTASDWSLLVQNAQATFETRHLDKMPQLLIDMLTSATTGTAHEKVNKRRQVDEFGRKFISCACGEIEQLIRTMHVLVPPRDMSAPQNIVARQHSLPQGSAAVNSSSSRTKLRAAAETLCRLENICKDVSIPLPADDDNSTRNFNSILKRVVAQHRQNLLLDHWSAIASTQDDDTLARLSKFFSADTENEAEIISAWNYELQLARDIVIPDSARAGDAELDDEALIFSLTLFKNFITSLEPTVEGLLESRQLLAEQQLVKKLLPQQIIEFFSNTLHGTERLYRIMSASVNRDPAPAANTGAHVEGVRAALLAVLGGASRFYVDAEGEQLAQLFSMVFKNAVAIAEEACSEPDAATARHHLHSAPALLQSISQKALFDNLLTPFIRRWTVFSDALSSEKSLDTSREQGAVARDMLAQVFKASFRIPIDDYFKADVAYANSFSPGSRTNNFRFKPPADFASWRSHAERLLVAANWTANVLNVMLLVDGQIVSRDVSSENHDPVELLRAFLNTGSNSSITAVNNSFIDSTRTFLTAAHAAMSLPIVAELMQDAENWSCWYDDRSLLPTYALAPQEYMTRIGQHLMMVLPGVLERFDFADADNVAREYCAGLRTAVALATENTNPSRQMPGVVAFCLEAATHGVVEAVLDRLTGVIQSERATRAGYAQCRADLEYLQNVVEEFGFSSNERLLNTLNESRKAAS